MAEVCLIVPTYNHLDYAHRCIDSFIKTTENVDSHVLLIDDCSPDWKDMEWPDCNLTIHRYDTHGWLTRSWNYGLYMAMTLKHTYTICANSDLLFVDGWYEPLRNALDSHSFVGPITNTPGHCGHQNIKNYGIVVDTDDIHILNRYAEMCRRFPTAPVKTNLINGFCMMASTDTWWKCKYDEKNVFNPAMRLVGNEDEFQRRLRAKGLSIAYVPQSFVFHYRSVSRPAALSGSASRGAFRPGVGIIR